MVLPKTIDAESSLDPLFILPVPETLPAAPAADHLDALNNELESYLARGKDALPLPVLATGMRDATRNTQVLVNAARVGAAEGRAALDDEDVKLRTVTYELDRVRDEMALCMEYEPMYENLDMPTEAELLENATPELLASLPPDEDETRAYALVIARLEAELAAIQEREARVASLTQQRDAFVRARREVKAKFEAVDVFLVDFAKTSNAMATKIRDVAKAPSAPKEEKEEKPATA